MVWDCKSSIVLCCSLDTTDMASKTGIVSIIFAFDEINNIIIFHLVW